MGSNTFLILMLSEIFFGFFVIRVCYRILRSDRGFFRIRKRRDVDSIEDKKKKKGMSTPSTSPARSDRTVERTNPEDLIREIKLLVMNIRRCHRAIAIWREKIAEMENDAAPLPAMVHFQKGLYYWDVELARLHTLHNQKVDYYNNCITTYDD